MAKPLPKLERETTGLKVFPLFTILGWALVGFAIVISVAVLSPTGSAYFGSNAKVVRDAAVVGESLLTDLTAISSWPKILAPLTFLGVASFMVGIALEFAAIPAIIDRRTEALKKALPLMAAK
ncbi:MAG: hypothetical protein WA996_17580 [Candidatus Promineifilaceae bacterium]